MMSSKDIAKIAGVSRSTVSRVINNYKNVPPETRKKVMEVIEKYNYRPQMSGRVLSGKKTNTIGIFVVSISPENDSFYKLNLFNNNYFGPIVDAIIDIANANGYYTIVKIIYKKEDYSKLIDTFAEKRIDGGIIIGLNRKENIIFDIAKILMPFILIHYDENYLFKNINSDVPFGIVSTFDYEAAIEATDYLISHGHKKIAFVSGRLNNYSAYERLKGFFETMKKNNFEIKKEYIIFGNYLIYKTHMEIKKLIEQTKDLPTAIICANDDMALETINTLKTYGIKIPEDISIIGFDDIPFANLSSPTLTTMKMPLYNMAETSFQFLDNLLKGKTNHFFKKFNLTLAPRESVKKIS